MTNERMPVDEIRFVLNREIIEPFIEISCIEPEISLQLSNALYLTRFTELTITNKIESQSENVKQELLFMGYFGKIYESCLYILGATDYIGSIVLMRALFELLIGISTEEKSSMSERIKSIKFLSNHEQQDLKALWNNLNSWTHPYGKWLNNVCPKLYGTGRNHNRQLFIECLEFSNKILDFMLLVAVEVLLLSIDSYKACLATYAFPDLPMFFKRFRAASIEL